MKHLTFNNILLLGLAIMFVWIGYMTYLQYRPVEPITVNVQPFKIINKTLKVGDPILFEGDSCRHGKYQVTVYPALKGATTRNLPSTTFVLTPGCTKMVNSNNIIPFGTPPGRYYLELNNKIQVLQNRIIDVQTVTEEFTIE